MRLTSVLVTGPWVDVLRRTGGIGLPFLPVVVAELEGAFRARGRLAIVVLLGLAAGLAGRTRAAPAAFRPAVRNERAPLDLLRGGLILGAVVVASLWAPALSLPRPPGGEAVAWPPAWAAILIGAAGLGGSAVERVVTSSRRTVAAPPWAPLMVRVRRLDHLATPTALWVALGALAAAAATLWLVGLGRGFL